MLSSIKGHGMKRGMILTLFFTAHIGFIFLQIHQYMRFIRQSFAKQKSEKLLVELKKEKQELANQLTALENNAHIKQYALQYLGMKTASLKQIKRLDHE